MGPVRATSPLSLSQCLGLESSLGFLPLFAGPVYGPSRLAASLVLAIMVLPTITAVSRDVLRAIPNAQREAALALGATHWEMISQVLLPYGTSGFLGAIILGLGRALGETIAVTMVIGNNLDLTASLLHPGYTMASVIANEFTEATFDLYLHALIEIGLVLFVMTLRDQPDRPAPGLARDDQRPRRARGMNSQSAKRRLQVPQTRRNIAMLGLTGLFTLIGVMPLIWILVYVVQQGLPALSPRFFTTAAHPGRRARRRHPQRPGRLADDRGPWAAGRCAGGCHGRHLRRCRPNTALGDGGAVWDRCDLAGVPSIVMGIFAYTLIVLPQRHFSAFSGGIVLCLHHGAHHHPHHRGDAPLVPGTLREGSLALGAPEWRTSFSVVLPAALNGLVTGIMLAIARGAGEAAPMLFTAFGNPFLSFDFSQPVATLPHMIYIYAISPYKDWHDKAWATALVLIAIVLVLNARARLLVWWRTRRLGTVR